MANILVVEDEHHLAQGLCFNLEADGHTVTVSSDGESGLQKLVAAPGHFDAVILDVMLPGRDGFEIASELRRSGDFVPILMLTARGRAEDILRGFESGADDYLPKPFDLEILLARVRGLLRRSGWTRAVSPPAAPKTANVITFGGNTLDLDALELRVGTMPYHLTLMEADLLQYLLKNAGKVVSRKAILEDVWNVHEDTDTRAIDNFIVRLRRFLNENPTAPRHVLTVRGIGYKFVANPDE
ncbi:MAG TPA: response regulator transcription factor [Vicinamibacterales bacterium]|nr:response regulator transcription factor [Vicinamibacterales bacterium]